jgi:hypothetical protein
VRDAASGELPDTTGHERDAAGERDIADERGTDLDRSDGAA